jgi:hypothetical protein
MKTFFNILQTLVNIKNKSFSTIKLTTSLTDAQQQYVKMDYNSELKIYIKFFIKTIMKIEQKHKYETNVLKRNAISKFKSLKQIIENKLMHNTLKDEIINTFIIAQRHHNAFIRLAHIYRLKKHPYIVTNDLYMRPLNVNSNNTFILVETNTKCNFLFNINDIINIIETSICNSPNFFSQPKRPTNPYNNQPLKISTLYNVYYQIKQSNRVMPVLLHLFFLENFNADMFSQQHEATVREYAIKKFVFNSHYSVLYTSVIYMLKQNSFTQRLMIHNSFPKKLLVDIFRPFLFYDFIIKYYINDTTKVYEYEHTLLHKLRKFYQYNHLFGRKYYKVDIQNQHNKKTNVKLTPMLNTEHISFYKIRLP